MDSTPGRVTPTVVGKQMSSKLREKLKRCGRYHCSPLSNKKTLDVESPGLALLARGDNPVTPQTNTQFKSVTPYHKRPRDANDELFPQPKAGKRLFGDSPSGKMSVQVNESDNLNDSENISQTVDQGETCAKPEPHKVSTRDKRLKLRTLDKVCIENTQLKTVDEKGKIFKTVNLSKSEETKVLPSVSKTAFSQIDSKCPDTECEKNEKSVNLLKKRDSLRKFVDEKRETLRKLKLVQLYRKKNNLVHLQTLICKWRAVSQQALEDLHEKLPEPKPSLTELVNHLQLDHNLIRFDPDDETFH